VFITSGAAIARSSLDRYLLGSYRIATAPEPNSMRLTSFKSRYFDTANNVGPYPSSANARGAYSAKNTLSIVAASA
jgi:hypothetical protein